MIYHSKKMYFNNNNNNNHHIILNKGQINSYILYVTHIYTI